MGKLGDLWVRLGLKKDEYSKGIKDAKQETSSFVGPLKNIGMLGKAAFAGIAAGVVAVVGAIKELSNQNQTLGDAVGKLSAGFDAMFDTLKTSLAALDFSDLITNLLEANHLARELYDAYDAMGEIGTGYNIALAQQLKHINELKLALRNQNLSDEERIEKGKELLKIYEELEKNPTRGLERVKDTTLDYYMQRMGVVMDGRTDQQMAAMRKKYADFFVWLGTTQGETYSAAAQEVAKTFGGLDSNKGRAYMRNAANNGMAEYARLAYEYNKRMGDKDREKIEKAVVGYYEQEAKFSTETLNVQNQINRIRSQQGGSGKDSEKKRIEAIKIGAKEEKEALVAKYEDNLQLLKKYGEDTTELTAQFSRDIVAALKIEASNPDDLAEKVMDDPDRLKKHYDELLAIMQKYGLDSTALTEKYNNLLIEAEREYVDASEEEQERLDKIARHRLDVTVAAYNVDLDKGMTDLRRMTDATMAEVERQEDALARWKEIMAEFADAVSMGFSGACQEMMDQFMGLEEINPSRVVQALLTPLADMAIKEGEILIATGIGVEAVKEALSTLQGPAAIAAGATLVAIGAAAKSGLAALAQSGGRSTSTSTYSGGSGASGTQNFETEMTIYVKGTIRGSDIVLSGQKTVSNWNR